MTITPEQLKFRKGKIGASDYANALGRGYYKSPAYLYHQLTSDGEGYQTEETLAMRVGTHMESLILREYNRQTGYEAVPYGDTLVHPDEGRLICHCDGKEIGRDILVEIKNVGPRMKSAWEDGPPEYVVIQACGQSMLDGCARVDIVAYFGGNDLKVFEFTFSKSDWATLYDGLCNFLGYVDRKEEPPVSTIDLPFLKEYYHDEGTSIQAPFQVKNACEFLAEIKKADKALKESLKIGTTEAEFLIQAFMKENSILLDDDGVVLYTWKSSKPKEVVDWEGVAKHFANEINRENGGSFYTDNTIKNNAFTKQGSRRFLNKIKMEED